MQELRRDHSNDPATKVALTRNDIAHQSVQALLDDLDYVSASLPAAEQQAAAAAVLDHHHPAVDEALLSTEGTQIQRAARAALKDLAGIGEITVVQSFDDVLVLEDTAPAVAPIVPAPRNMKQLAITLALTGSIAAGGFTVGAILQRLV